MRRVEHSTGASPSCESSERSALRAMSMQDVGPTEFLDGTPQLENADEIAGARSAMDIDPDGAIPVRHVLRQPVGELRLGANSGMHEQHVESERRQSLGDVEHVFPDAAA